MKRKSNWETTADLATQVWRRSAKLRLLRGNVLRLIAQHQPIVFWDLVKYGRLAYRNALFCVEMLGREGVVMRTDEGLCLANGDLIGSRNLLVCPMCAGCTIPWSFEVQQIAPMFRQIVKKRPTPILLFGHRGITADSTLHRIAYMFRRDDVIDREIVFVGDNDLASIALGLTGLSRRLTVVDIDERLIEFINATAAQHNIEIETHVYDCHDPVPLDLCGVFDVFWCDPYPTADASFERLFWSRGVAMLRSGAGQVGYAMSAPSHKLPAHFLAGQRLLSEMGLVITDIVPFFNDYVTLPEELTAEEETWLDKWTSPDGALSHTKSLIRFETTEAAKDKALKPSASEVIGERILGRWIAGQLDHYLLVKLGVATQIELAQSSLTSNPRWQRALSRTSLYTPPNTLKVQVTNLVCEITGRLMGSDDYLRLAKAQPHTLIEWAAERGYDLMPTDIEILADLCLGVKELPKDPIKRRIIAEVFLLARLFESYYRE